MLFSTFEHTFIIFFFSCRCLPSSYSTSLYPIIGVVDAAGAASRSGRGDSGSTDASIHLLIDLSFNPFIGLFIA